VFHRITKALECIAQELKIGNSLKEKLMGKIDDLTTALTTSLDNLAQSITDEIARVEAIIAAGGLTQAQGDALQAQVDRLTAFKATLDAERPDQPPPTP
jgi:prefoldin subunit 5